MVPEMISRDAYGAINGALVAPMNVTLAVAPLAAAWIWSETGGHDAVLVAIGIGAIVLCVGFWTAAALSRRGDFHPGERDAALQRLLKTGTERTLGYASTGSAGHCHLQAS